jgi:NTE family protein
VHQDPVDPSLTSSQGRSGAVAPNRVAFVLTGGASRAAVQVGMLMVLTEAGIRPDLVVGVSAGAVNAVSYAADPTDAGVSRLLDGWRQTRRSQVFPLWSSSLILGAVGRRDHLLSNRGLAKLIVEFVECELLEATVVPAHVVATDSSTHDPVVLSRGPVLPALLASTAIPGVFPPVNVGGQLLIDGGVGSHSSTREAESLGATTIYVLPTFGVDRETRPGQRRRARSSRIGRLFGDSGAGMITPTTRSALRLLPAPSTAAISPYDFSHTAQLIDQAAALTRSWLADEVLDNGLPASNSLARAPWDQGRP